MKNLAVAACTWVLVAACSQQQQQPRGPATIDGGATMLSIDAGTIVQVDAAVADASNEAPDQGGDADPQPQPRDASVLVDANSGATDGGAANVDASSLGQYAHDGVETFTTMDV